MRYSCDKLFRGQYIHLRKLFIPLCLNSPDRHSFNLLRIITLLYNIYIEYEIYNLSYNTGEDILYGGLFVYGTMCRWDHAVKLLEIRSNMGH